MLCTSTIFCLLNWRTTQILMPHYLSGGDKLKLFLHVSYFVYGDWIIVLYCVSDTNALTYTPISKNVVGENGEWQLSNGNCTTERNCGFYIWYAKTMSSSRGARLDGNKNPLNLHIWQWKTVFLHALHVHFSSFDILKMLSFCLWREITCFAVVWTTWAYDDKCSILSCPERWFQFNSWIVKAHFSGIMTFNNWKMIAETRSDIFRWRYRFRRRRVCWSSLLILP